MKRVAVALVLAFAAAFLLVACGDRAPESQAGESRRRELVGVWYSTPRVYEEARRVHADEADSPGAGVEDDARRWESVWLILELGSSGDFVLYLARRLPIPEDAGHLLCWKGEWDLADRQVVLRWESAPPGGWQGLVIDDGRLRLHYAGVNFNLAKSPFR